jgi:hypothetical protein
MEELMSKLVNNAGDPGLEASLCLHFVSKYFKLVHNSM